MSDNWFIKIIFLPISLLYGIGVAIRNFLYQSKVYQSISFDVPVISVGNLAAGGTGKTPHVEYLIRLLKEYIHIATLSRGYGRKTEGFRLVQYNDTAHIAGDEPVQFKRKNPNIIVAVAEERTFGITQIMGQAPQTQTILLDDAYQHLSVKPGLNILLTAYSKPYFKDFPLPTGNLREWPTGASRADIIIVTKCPDDMTESAKERFIKRIAPKPHQKVFFTKYVYGDPYYMYQGSQRVKLSKEMDTLLVSGIARTDYMLYYLESKVKANYPIEFKDHHMFDEKDIERIKISFDKLNSQQKIMLTTEKDAIRLDAYREKIQSERWPIFVLPIQVEFLFDQRVEFDKSVKDFLLEFRV